MQGAQRGDGHGPTSASDGVRSPPVSRTEVVASPERCSTSATQTELVTTVRSGMPGQVLGEGVGRRPGRDGDRHAGVHQLGGGRGDGLLLAPALDRLGREARLGGGRLGHRHAPPCTFSSSPSRCSATRSRRTVMSETPSRSTRSVTRTVPSRSSSARMRLRRCAASISVLLAPRRRRRQPPRSPSTVRPETSSDTGHGDRGGSSPWLTRNSQDASSPTRRVTSTRSAAPGSRPTPPRRPAARPAGRCRRASSRVATYHAVPWPTVAGSRPARPARARRRSRHRLGPGQLQVLGPHVGGDASSPSPHPHRSPSSSGRNSSTRTPSRSRKAPGSRRAGCGRARRRCR